VLTRSEEVGGYAADASIARTSDDALAVVLPNSTEQVCRVLASAAAAGVPVVTRGAASGLAGGATASEGALIVSLNRMQRLHIDAHQRVARAEAGVVTADLQQAAEQHGLFYPPDPSSQTVSTIGGNIACNAGGPRCVKYGVTADYVLELTAVLADGRLVRVGDGITGQSPHTDLMHLLIGSEGTLALITEATLHLLPRPPARRTTVALFERLDDACATVEAIIAAGMLPAALELMDDTTIAVIDDYLHLGLPRDVEALLLLMADGSGEAVNDESELLANFARRGGARTVQVAGSARDEALLWRGRRAIGPALARVRPNRLSEDICVPVPQVAATVKRIKQVAAEYGLPIPVFGHAGDGNLHPNMLFDARDPAQVEQAWQAAEAVFRVALEMGGTLSGEHGIGILKRPFMPLALGADVLAMQQAIKAWFDPQGRLNPGKVLPPR
jgi:glycolate oxidase subunit GlcD